jgi:cytochrome c biogenesis protein
MNSPFDYRGYRMFQASVNQLGNARTIKIKAMPASGGDAQEVTIPRNGQAKLPDGTVLIYREFNPAFTVDRDGRVDIGAAEYENPAAHLDVIYPDGDNRDVWAFTEGGRLMLEQAPFLKAKFGETGAKQFVLADFEKVPTTHNLSIQYDPGVKVVYTGFTILCLTLMAVFFFSHQRLWIVVEDGKVTLGGDANRNRLSFEDRVKRVAAFIQTGQKAQPAG